MADSDESAQVPFDIPHRDPIITQENPYNPAEIDRQWTLTTEVIKRQMLNRSDVRQELIKFCRAPLSEDLPHELLLALGLKDERIQAIANRYHGSVQSYLDLPAVPDELIVPDIKNTKKYTSPSEVTRSLKDAYGTDKELIDMRLQQIIEQQTSSHGLTDNEKTMIAQRYKCARDSKILALGAELLEYSDNLSPMNTNDVVLPSGTRILINPAMEHIRSDFLKPHLWEKRRQFKDRVYEVSVNGQKYILKEKKTARHTDTAVGGHREGLTAQEEFHLAKKLHDSGTVEEENVKTSFENPVGFVEFPDGYQFVLFEYTDGFSEDQVALKELEQNIIAHQELFQQDYEILARRALHFLHPTANSNLNDTNLSYQDFALVKAYNMLRKARQILKEKILELGYDNQDMSYIYNIRPGLDSMYLEVTGFDFEYAELSSAHDKQNAIKEFREVEHFNAESGMALPKGRASAIQEAAHLAMIESEEAIQ